MQKLTEQPDQEHSSLSMEPFDERDLIVPCADCFTGLNVPLGYHVVVSGTLMIRGVGSKWLILTEEGYEYVDLSLGTVVDAMIPRPRMPEPCERVRLRSIDKEIARQVADELIVLYANNFDENRLGGLFYRFYECEGCGGLLANTEYTVPCGANPSDEPGYYLNPVHGAPILRLMWAKSLRCTCPRR